jgi:predicted anti-sigma-YlaC factor YlaD
MTKDPGCRTIERFLVTDKDGALGPAEQRLVEGHLRSCAACRAFAADRALIRREIASAPWPSLPEELDRRTRRALRASGAAAGAPTVPGWVLVALAVFTVVTGIWLAVSLADISPDTRLADLPVVGLAAIIVIAQNALMLFFAPVVLRTFRSRRESARRAG